MMIVNIFVRNFNLLRSYIDLEIDIIGHFRSTQSLLLIEIFCYRVIVKDIID